MRRAEIYNKIVLVLKKYTTQQLREAFCDKGTNDGETVFIYEL